MQDVIVGLLALLIGAVFCLRGYLAMRLVIPIWGAFAGFMLGAGLVASFTDEGFLRGVLAWTVGLAVGILFGLVAYLYYEISVLIAMASIGFTLGTSAMVAFGVEWTWAVALVGIATGAALAFIAIAADLPTVLLIVLTALAGSSAIVAGLMLLFGTLDTADFTTTAITESLDDRWWWWVLYTVLAVVGIAVQIQAISSIRGSIRAQWTAEGGQSLRSTT